MPRRVRPIGHAAWSWAGSSCIFYVGDTGQRGLDRSPGTVLSVWSVNIFLRDGVSGMPVEAKLVVA